MMRIREVRVGMRQGFVGVRVTMPDIWRHRSLVFMLVMRIVHMLVVMHRGVVFMFVLMALG